MSVYPAPDSFLHVIAIKTNGTLWAWGRNQYGQLGLGFSENSTISVIQLMGSSSDWSKVAVGEAFTASVKSSGQLWAWGSNSFGQLGDNTAVIKSSPVQIGSSTDWSLITCTRYSAHAIKTTGTLWSWGRNNNGQLGLGNTTNRSSPVQVGTATDWSFISGGREHVHAIKTTGALWAWGANSFLSNPQNRGAGRLGVGDYTNRSSPVQIGTDTNWSKVSSGSFHGLAIKTTGTLWSWGTNHYGQIGIGTISDFVRSSPVQIGSDSDWSLFDVGPSDGIVNSARTMSILIKSNGTIWASGTNTVGQLGLGDKIRRSSPVQIGTDSNWSKVSVGQSSTYANRNFCVAIKTTGTMWSWGSNTQGALGLRDLIDRSSPVQIGTSTDWASVACGRSSVLAIKTTGTLWAWGRNNYGQLGTGNTTGRSSPVQVGTATDWSSVSIRGSHCIAVKTNGTLWSWGANGGAGGGRLGLGDTTNRSSPVQIGTATDWSSATTSNYSSFAIKTTGTLWAWGQNIMGKLGIGDSTNRSSPVQVGTDTNWSKVSTGGNSTMAVRTTGTLWGWGLNSYGMLGTMPTSSSPVQIGSSADWKNVSLSYRFSVMSKTTDTLWAMGRNDNGSAMFSYSGNIYDPVQVGTDTNWSDVCAGIYHSVAIKTTGTIWAWGRNNYGQLGVGDTTNRSSPVQIGASTDWSMLIPSLSASVGAVKTNGTFFVWGQNNSRQLGLGGSNNVTSPTQIGSDTDWQGVGGMRNHIVIKKGSGGQLWSAGLNSSAQASFLYASVSSPIQVGSSTNWYRAAAENSASFAIDKQTV